MIRNIFFMLKWLFLNRPFTKDQFKGYKRKDAKLELLVILANLIKIF